MKLDGEKLLAKLEELVDVLAADKVKYLNEGHLLEAGANDIAASSYQEVINAIKSGDYTIEDKG